jgi:adenosylhomocysteinase
MDGCRVMPMRLAAGIGDIFITVTGDKHVIGKEIIPLLKDGAILANSGHFNVEIDIPALEALSSSKRRVREYVDEYTVGDGRRVYLLGKGRLINLAAAEGHPASVMDMSFANQALCLEYLIKHRGKLETRVFSVPQDIDKNVARLKLASMGMDIDTLTPEQVKYLAGWEEGT